jgi:hypothetical protein
MNQEIGTAAGAMWQALHAKGEMTLAKLKKEIGGESPIFECAIGWLAREDKVFLVREKKSYRVHLKEEHGQRANAA